MRVAAGNGRGADAARAGMAPSRPCLARGVARMRIAVNGWLVLAALVFPLATVSAEPAGPAATSVMRVAGGEVTIGLDPDALAALDLQLAGTDRARDVIDGVRGRREHRARFDAREGDLDLRLEDGIVVALGAGTLHYAGGPVFTHAGRRIALAGFGLRASAAAPLDLELVDAGGTVWFGADHAHHGIEEGEPRRFAMRAMNLRLSPHFARVLGDAARANLVVGSLDLVVQVEGAGSAQAGRACSAPWPAPGLRTDVALIRSNLSGFWDAVYAPRCGRPPLPDGGACTATDDDGFVVIGADASLRNVGETAIPWHARFSGNHPPHGGDQHPVLVWNLYRIGADGRIRQIGASGAKHAFYSVNRNCGCAGGNVFWPGCDDIYSFASNDNGGGVQHLAPRAEIIPYGVRWARCGSAWDSDCDGRMDAGSGAQDLYQHRLLARERDLLPPLADGADYLFEYWYLVRDDGDLYNTIGHRRIRPRKLGANWSVQLVDATPPHFDFHVGPALDRWVDRAQPPAHAANRELATPDGRARIAAKATDLGDGRWRYEYAVMNFDYARVAIDPVHPREPDLRLLAQRGFARFEVQLPAGVRAQEIASAGLGDATAGAWRARQRGRAVEWTAPSLANTLEWGMLRHFEFVAAVAPGVAAVQLAGAAMPQAPEQVHAMQLPGPMAPSAKPPSP